MYIGHYKSVNASKEFYSSVRDQLDFPTQAILDGERYLLLSTHFAATKSQKDNINSRASQLGIKTDVKVD
jgi:hypothetical protein